MVSQRLLLSRITFLKRPLRPPNQPPQLRLFTQNTQLLLISPHSPRPQLPFLYSAPRSLAAQPAYRSQFRTQLARYLTTEGRQKIVSDVKLGIKWGAYSWIALGLLSMIYVGLQQEYLERRYPSPPDWSFISRFIYRRACSREDSHPTDDFEADTVNTGSMFLRVIERLEDPAKDGAGLLPTLKDEGDIYVEGLGRTGFDITSKSEPWRRGYFESIMGIARGAEANEDKVLDQTQGTAYPKNAVIGPSNPRPKPIPFGVAGKAPLEENCVPLFPAPETFYMKILTTQGFDTRQRLDAALAYADLLDYKGLHSTAEDMYDWGLDIAMGALPEGVNNVVDTKTGVINGRAEYISSNILSATTALAAHHARNNNPATALPIFLSVLRARRQLPLSPSLTDPPPPPSQSNNADEDTFLSFIESLFYPPSYPPAPPTGDEQPLRTPASICEEAGLMVYIGEILFASSLTESPSEQNTPRISGLGWTRDAIDLAETTLSSLPSTKKRSNDKSDETKTRNKCLQCVETGTENWRLMVRAMLREEKKKQEESPVSAAEEKTRWFSWGRSKEREEEGGESRWKRELEVVEGKLREMKKAAFEEEENAQLSVEKYLRQFFVLWR